MIVDENGTRRKISKRKDVDFTTMNYAKEGFPAKAMQEYLITIANTSFEAWRQANPRSPLTDFDFSFSKVGSSPLFDYNKLVNLSRGYMSYLTKDELYEEATTWAKEFDKELYDILTENKEYTLNVLNIEREKKKPRKDYAKYSDIRTMSWYMFPKLFDKQTKEYEYQTINKIEDVKEIVNEYFNNYYDENDDHDTWFEKMKELSEKLGYTTNLKDYKENPGNYKGSITDVATVIRVAITTKSQTPDLYEILHVLGKEEVVKRIELIK
jgi:glutamyl-tRNA synthetase